MRPLHLIFRIISPNGRVCVMEHIDKPFLVSQTEIALQEYDRKGLPNSGPFGNLAGLIGEYTFQGLLEKNNIEHEWNKRKPEYWELTADQRSWDFKLANGTTFEIGTIMPFHAYAMLKNAPHKLKSDFFVQVKLMFLRTWVKIKWHDRICMFGFDANRGDLPYEITDKEEFEHLEKSEKNAFAKAEIEGFDTIANIKAFAGEWRFSEKGEKLTPEEDAYCEPLMALKGFDDLIAIITGKPKRVDQPKKSSEQLHFRKKGVSFI